MSDAKKATEETWRVRNSPGCRDDIYCDDARVPGRTGYIFGSFGDALGEPEYPIAQDRAHLAAAAPDLYRALKAVEWSDSSDSTAKCPMCGAWQEGTPSSRVGPSLEPREHRGGCALSTALAKAEGR